tara:strand:- start:4185 stop:5132 length:948 start_codon:yes stop_codon:yes gene_type:complete
MISISEYPWIDKTIDGINISSLPHANLIEGSSGVGKFILAKKIAKSILCDESSIENCQGCNSCNLIKNNTHPDLLINQDESKISIDEIRKLIEFANLSSSVSGSKVIILQNCENMKKESQNAILKTLEEPPINTFIIMTSGKRRSLNQTIYSRCNKILIRDLDQNEVTDWIKSQGIDDFNFYDYPSYISPIDILKSINNGRANDFLEFNRVLIDFFLKNDNTNQSLKKILEIDLSVSNKINSIVDILVSILKSKQIDKYFSGKLKELNQLQFSGQELSELIDEMNELRDMHNKVSGLNEKHTLKYFIFKIDSIIK